MCHRRCRSRRQAVPEDASCMSSLLVLLGGGRILLDIHVLDKGCLISGNHLLYCQRRPTRNALDEVIRPAKQSIIQVNGSFTQMLACMRLLSRTIGSIGFRVPT